MSQAVTKKEGWINLYKVDHQNLAAITSNAFPTKEHADSAVLGNRIACVKVEWETPAND
jgi:hypothetical protein